MRFTPCSTKARMPSAPCKSALLLPNVCADSRYERVQRVVAGVRRVALVALDRRSSRPQPPRPTWSARVRAGGQRRPASPHQGPNPATRPPPRSPSRVRPRKSASAAIPRPSTSTGDDSRDGCARRPRDNASAITHATPCSRWSPIDVLPARVGIVAPRPADSAPTSVLRLLISTSPEMATSPVSRTQPARAR